MGVRVGEGTRLGVVVRVAVAGGVRVEEGVRLGRTVRVEVALAGADGVKVSDGV
jgi:hypothetical protein